MQSIQDHPLTPQTLLTPHSTPHPLIPPLFHSDMQSIQAFSGCGSGGVILDVFPLPHLHATHTNQLQTYRYFHQSHFILLFFTSPNHQTTCCALYHSSIPCLPSHQGLVRFLPKSWSFIPISSHLTLTSFN